MSYEELKYGKNSDLENWVELLCFVQLSKQLGDCLNVRCYQSYYHLIKIKQPCQIVDLIKESQKTDPYFFSSSEWVFLGGPSLDGIE